MTRRSRAHANSAPEGRRVAHSSAACASISISRVYVDRRSRANRGPAGHARIHTCGARRSPAAALAAADAARPSHVWGRGGAGRRAPLLAWRWRRERGGSAATSGGESGPYPIEMGLGGRGGGGARSRCARGERRSRRGSAACARACAAARPTRAHGRVCSRGRGQERVAWPRQPQKAKGQWERESNPND